MAGSLRDGLHISMTGKVEKEIKLPEEINRNIKDKL